MASPHRHASENSITTPKTTIKGIPDFGWRVNLSHECSVKCKPFDKPRFSQVIQFVGLGIRYWSSASLTQHEWLPITAHATTGMDLYACKYSAVIGGFYLFCFFPMYTAFCICGLSICECLLFKWCIKLVLDDLWSYMQITECCSYADQIH
jgi:hypothetical protein